MQESFSRFRQLRLMEKRLIMALLERAKIAGPINLEEVFRICGTYEYLSYIPLINSGQYKKVSSASYIDSANNEVFVDLLFEPRSKKIDLNFWRPMSGDGEI